MALTQAPKPTKHALNNPDRITQPTRSRPPATEAQKATRKLGQQNRNQKNQLLATDIESYIVERDAKIEALAVKHSVTSSFILKTIHASTGYKKTRAPNLHNALSHIKKLEVNQDMDPGHRANLQELQELVRNDDKLKNLSTTQKKDILKTLEDFRDTKSTAICPSNRSAALDARATITRLTTELDSLLDCTGVHAIIFITWGNLEDQIEPEWFASGTAINFFYDILHLDPWDVTGMFEQWACSKLTDASVRENIASLRADCAKIILSGLKFASKAKVIAMNYKNYGVAIVLEYHVKLVGWTHSEMISPSDISSTEALRTLRGALRSGACKWIRLSTSQVAEYKAELEGGGEPVSTRKRKERSDKGTTRKPKASGSKESTKRQKTGQLPPKSKEIVLSSDDNSSDYET